MLLLLGGAITDKWSTPAARRPLPDVPDAKTLLKDRPTACSDRAPPDRFHLGDEAIDILTVRLQDLSSYPA
jgi:hypothetical protein